MGKSQRKDPVDDSPTDVVFSAFKRAGLAPQLEYRFHHTRMWRFDVALPENLVAVEIQGGLWTAQSHATRGGYLRDIEKRDEAEKLGWKIYYVPPSIHECVRLTELIIHSLVNDNKLPRIIPLPNAVISFTD